MAEGREAAVCSVADWVVEATMVVPTAGDLEVVLSGAVMTVLDSQVAVGSLAEKVATAKGAKSQSSSLCHNHTRRGVHYM